MYTNEKVRTAKSGSQSQRTKIERVPGKSGKYRVTVQDEDGAINSFIVFETDQNDYYLSSRKGSVSPKRKIAV